MIPFTNKPLLFALLIVISVIIYRDHAFYFSETVLLVMVDIDEGLGKEQQHVPEAV